MPSGFTGNGLSLISDFCASVSMRTIAASSSAVEASSAAKSQFIMALWRPSERGST